MTKFSLVPALLLTMSSAHTHAGPPADTSDDSSAEAEIIALTDAWIDAEVTGDRAALERILHEDFLATYPSGRTVDRATFIDIIVNARLAPFTVSNESITVHGDTAVVIDVSEDGKTKFTWIAVRRDGEWRAISETFSRIETP